MKKTQTRHNMRNVAFERLKKDMLSENCFYTRPYRKWYESIGMDEGIFKRFKREELAAYSLMMYCLSKYSDQIEPEIKSMIESWIEKVVVYDWASLDDKYILSLCFAEKLILTESFYEKYLKEMNIPISKSASYLEINAIRPCQDSIVGVTNNNFHSILGYLIHFLRGNNHQPFFWPNINSQDIAKKNFDAILLLGSIGKTFNTAEQVFSNIQDSLRFLKPEGCVIYEQLSYIHNCFSLDDKTTIQYEKRKLHDILSKLYEAKLLRAVVHKEGAILIYVYPQYAGGIHFLGEKDNIQPFDDKYIRKSFDFKALKGIDLYYYLEHIALDLHSNEIPVTLRDVLKPLAPTSIVNEQGRIFKYKNMSTGYDNWKCNPEDLDTENVTGTFIKATGPVCVLNQNLRNPVMTYIYASENEPVYFRESHFMVFTINESIICPEYFYHILFNGEFLAFFSEETFLHIENFPMVAGGFVDDEGVTVRFANRADALCSSMLWLKVPREIEIQERTFESAKAVWNVMAGRVESQKAKINELEWLNEDHIRNIKHKIHGDLGTVKRDFLTLNKAFERNKGQLKLCDKFSSSPNSKRTVEDALGTIMRGLNKAIETVAELTEVAMKKKEINIYEFYSEYVANTHYANQCDIQFSQCAKNLNIIIDPGDLVKVTDLFIENAIRHGKLDEQGTGLKIRMGCKDLFDGQCLITLENNGKKMPPRAKEIYFTRGGYVGETGNTGQGGADIKRAIEANGGKVDLDRSVPDDAEYPVCLMINFPVSNY